MVSTWRFYSFKDIDFRSRHPFRLIVLFARSRSRRSGSFPGRRFSPSRFCTWLPAFCGACSGSSTARLRLHLPRIGRHLTLHESTLQNSAFEVRLRSQADLRGTNLYRVAIVGAASLKGKEIAEILRERNFPAVDVRLLDDDESLGQLEAVGDEMSFIQSIRSEQFERVDFAFFASDPRSTRKNWRAARDLGDTIVDLSFALEDEAGASVRSPWIERQTSQPIAPELQPGPVVVAHPAATVLALLALRSEKVGKIQRMIATVFEPASENGQKGMDELHEQTVNLLSFQELPKNVFDIQVAFNMVPRYGQRSELSLEAVSQTNPEALWADCPAARPSLRCRCCRRQSSMGMAFRFTWRWKSQSQLQIFPRPWPENTSS